MLCLWCRASKWTTCSLTGAPLQGQIAADYIGQLFNRDALVEFLLARSGKLLDGEASLVRTAFVVLVSFSQTAL